MQVMKVTAIALPWLIFCVPIRIFIKFLLLLTTGHLCVSCAILIHQSAYDPKRGTMKRRCFNAGHFLNEAGCVQATQNLTNASFHQTVSVAASDHSDALRSLAVGQGERDRPGRSVRRLAEQLMRLIPLTV